MNLEKKECEHIVSLLDESKKALVEKNAFSLKDLSNKTIHDACHYQDEASITIAVLLYSLSKIIEREDYSRMKNWDLFVKKFNAIIDLAILALNQHNEEAYQKYIAQARQTLESQSVNIKKYVEDVIRKASINKGSKLYSHGLSIAQTSQLLGVTQWELSEYIGEHTSDNKHDQTIDTKKRAKMALEFFG